MQSFLNENFNGFGVSGHKNTLAKPGGAEAEAESEPLGRRLSGLGKICLHFTHVFAVFGPEARRERCSDLDGIALVLDLQHMG